jgi:hypothetical protein
MNYVFTRLSHVWNCTDGEEGNPNDEERPGNKMVEMDPSFGLESVTETVGDTGGDPPNVRGDKVEPDDGVVVDDIAD